jgi:adenosylhomocysteine nucleosidase
VKVGDVVVARELLQHDMDASPLFPRHEIPLMGLSRIASDTVLGDSLANAAAGVIAQPGSAFVAAAGLLGAPTPALHRGLVISGDRFVSTAAESLALQAELPDALAVEMEGAALAQVCHGFGVPFAVLRTISDRADDNAHMDFSRFIDEVAARATHDIVRAWLRGR